MILEDDLAHGPFGEDPERSGAIDDAPEDDGGGAEAEVHAGDGESLGLGVDGAIADDVEARIELGED